MVLGADPVRDEKPTKDGALHTRLSTGNNLVGRFERCQTATARADAARVTSPVASWARARVQPETAAWIVLAVAVGLVGWSIVYSVQGAFLPELFPVQMRYTGAGLAYQITGAIGGSIPLVSVFLPNTFDTTVSVSLLVAATAVVTLFAIAVASETRRISYPPPLTVTPGNGQVQNLSLRLRHENVCS